MQTHALQDFQSSRISVTGLFNAPQEQALRDWNNVLAKINLTNLPHTPQQVAENRQAALQIYRIRFDENALNALSQAFSQLHVCWVNGDPPFEIIQQIISHLNQDLLNPFSGLVHYRSSFASMESRSIDISKDRSRGRGLCLVHPQKQALCKGLCNNCYEKARRLNLLHLDLGVWLSVLLKRRKPRDVSQCVNHAKIQSYADGLCVECLHRLGKLNKNLL
jgi:hypothetical protein